MAKTEERVKIKPNLRLAEPSMFKIIYMNDSTTTLEFVVGSLVGHLAYSADTALEVTQRIHETGSAVVAVLPHEIAEQKGVEVTLDAHSNGFPLKVMIESENL